MIDGLDSRTGVYDKTVDNFTTAFSSIKITFKQRPGHLILINLNICNQTYSKSVKSVHLEQDNDSAIHSTTLFNRRDLLVQKEQFLDGSCAVVLGANAFTLATVFCTTMSRIRKKKDRFYQIIREK